MSTYELKLEQFSGPLEKLLELIEEKKMEITRLNLAQVTADFIAYLSAVEKAAPGLLADFLAVASRLLLLKSKALLPDLVLEKEEEQEIQSLETRLKIYQRIKAAKLNLKEMWREKPLVYGREFLAGAAFSFYPPANLKPVDLKLALENLAKELQKFIYETKEFKLETVNLEEKMKEFLRKMEQLSLAAASFSQIANAQTKAEIIASFLAILHLIRDHLIKAEQKEEFAEIMIERVE